MYEFVCKMRLVGSKSLKFSFVQYIQMRKDDQCQKLSSASYLRNHNKQYILYIKKDQQGKVTRNDKKENKGNTSSLSSGYI